MARDMEVALWLRLRGSEVASAGIRKFSQTATQGFGQVREAARAAWQDMNGFSTAAKMLSAIGGFNLVRNAISTNLNFERDLLEMKQNADMTREQAAEIRKLAITGAQAALQTPSDMLAGAKAFARAGEKFDQVKIKTLEAARAATVFRATVEEIANMDFDLTDKLKIDSKRLPQIHNMLYYHGNAGRFEAPQLARQAPELFNAVAAVGIGGERGLNFTGALTQVLMKSASVNEPGKVSTLMQQGLGHITNPHYVKNLKEKFGIDVTKYAPSGKFYGEGGVDGLLDLADAMKKKGLMDPMKFGQVGSDQETTKFFRGLMQYSQQIREEMKNADGSAASDKVSSHLQEMQESNFGRVKKGEIEWEKQQLGESGQAGATIWGRLNQKFAEDPGDVVGAIAGAGGLVLAGRYSRKRRQRLAGEQSSAAEAAAGAVAVQKVFATNWPKGMLGPGEELKQKQNHRVQGGNTPNTPDVPDGGKSKGKLAKAAGMAGKGLGAGVAALSGWEIGYNQIGPVVNDMINAAVQSHTKDANATLGGWIYDLLHKDDNKPPQEIKVAVELKNPELLAAQVNQVNATEARRR